MVLKTPFKKSKPSVQPRDDLKSVHNCIPPRAYPFQLKLSYIVNAYFDQENHIALTSLLETYSSYDPSILDQIEFIVIDDGSPVPFELPDLNLNVSLVRADINKPWNSAGCKNLGGVLASTDKLLICDLDHVFPEVTLRKLIQMRNPKNRLYKFYTRSPDGSTARPHPNFFFLSRTNFLKHYGYDEEFAGYYGFEDTMFYRMHRTLGNPIFKLPKKYYKMERSLDRTKGYHNLRRDLRRNRPIHERKRKEWKDYGPNGAQSRKMLRFAWTLMEDRERVPSKLPKKRPLWLKLWPLRYAFSLFSRRV